VGNEQKPPAVSRGDDGLMWKHGALGAGLFVTGGSGELNSGL
jgi:hypothetical protein